MENSSLNPLDILSVIDFTGYGPVHDRDGDDPVCRDNIRELLVDLHPLAEGITLKTKFRVVHTRLRYDKFGENPRRYETEEVRTMRTLLRYYKDWFNQEFEFEKAKAIIEQDHQCRLAGYKQQGEKTWAWAWYSKRNSFSE